MMFIQTGIDAIKQVQPNTYMILLLSIFVAKEIFTLALKGVTVLRGHTNGKEKCDDTQKLPCFLNPAFSGSWETHKQEVHDTKVCSDRLEEGLGKLLKESLTQTHESRVQTTEMRKQTRVLEEIRKNGGP